MRLKAKRAVLSSILSLILCCTMFLGSTMAWFTSTASNKGNRIEAGELKIDLLMDKNKDGVFQDPDESIGGDETTGDIFSVETGGNGLLWEPGKTEIVYLQVANKGNLALKYNIELMLTASGLIDALEYAIIPLTDTVTVSAIEALTDWEGIEALGAAGVAEIGNVNTLLTDETAAPNGFLEQGENDSFALAVHMREDAGDEFQGKAFGVDVKVIAGQANVEYDSFGNTYDAEAPMAPVKDAEEAFNYLTNGDFEEVGTNGRVTGWAYKNIVADTDTITVIDSGAPSGDNYLKFARTGKKTPYMVQSLTTLEPGETYVFSGWAKDVNGSADNAVPQLNFFPKDAEGNAIGDSKNGIAFTWNATGVGQLETDTWTEVTAEVTVPGNAASVDVWIRLTMGQGEIHWDNVKLVKKDNNLLKNGNFEVVADSVPTGWKSNGTWGTDTIVVADSSVAKNGTNYLKLAANGERQVTQEIDAADYEALKGKTLTLTAYYTGTVTGTGAGYKITHGSATVGSYNFAQNLKITAGEWNELKYTFTFPEDATKFEILLRNNKQTGDIYFDDIKLVITEETE